jgi:natural product precursor
MESLDLEKFSDFKIEKQEMTHLIGGSSETTSEGTGLWGVADTRYDFWSDACEEGNWNCAGSHTVVHISY